MNRYRLAVDTGGTFCDFVLLDEATGRLTVRKVPSSPDAPARAIFQGVDAVEAPAADIVLFLHGTTVGTNALLEGKVARTGLLVTRGFRGILEVGEQARPYGRPTFDLLFDRPPSLCPPRRTAEVDERVGARGEVLRPLDAASVDRAIERLEAEGVDAAAVCFLFSFLRPEHEREAVARLRARHPEWWVTASSEVLPQIREYYRFSTAVANAALGPQLSRYMTALDAGLRARGLARALRLVMQSNGGTATFAQAARVPVTTVLSGPAAGVTAAAAIGLRAGCENVISFDMGGTSCDVALIERGRPNITTRGAVAGRPIAVPMLDIHSVSAGGGTLARVDGLGALRVGPESAGADPGPAAYGRGGATPTVTDADVVLGYLNPERFLGGGVRLDPIAAARALEEQVADPLGLPLAEAAAGVVRLINVQMAEAVRSISTERGYDVSAFPLVAFGGAGPVHAAFVAHDLGIPQIIVPPHPGATSAFGLLLSDVRRDYVRSQLSGLDAVARAEVEGALADLGRQATEDLAREGFGPDARRCDFALDLRYAGQGYELTVPVPAGKFPATEVRAAFDRLHEERFGHAAPNQPVELVSYRCQGIGLVPQPPAPRLNALPGTPDSRARRGARRAWFDGWVDTPLYDRERLGAGDELSGPAIIEQYDSTIVVPPGFRLRCDVSGNVVLTA
ncbi:MAG TPA: hydantoinase/oxoprolinase family protein [bacterium]|nr:hydantoinase/oxoprolinase family protein [bacterium]